MASVLSWCADLLRPVWGRFEASPVAQRLTHGALWSLGGALAARAAGLISSVVAARFLGQTGFGELAMVQSTAGVFTVFAGYGLGLTATKYIAEFRKTDSARVARILRVSQLMAMLVGGVTAAALFFAARHIAVSTLAEPHLTSALRIAAALLFLDAITSAQAGALSGFEAFRYIARINLWTGIASVPITIVGVYIAGLPGAISALVATRAITALLSHHALQQEAHLGQISVRLADCAKELKMLVTFTFPTVLSSFVTVGSSWACNAILVNRPTGYAELGLFNAASQWRSVIFYLPFTISGVCLPIATSLYAEGRYSAYRKLLRLICAINLAVVFGLATPIVILSGPLMASYGSGFTVGARVLIVLSASCLVLAVDYVTTHALMSQGLIWPYLAYTVLCALVLVTSTNYFVARGLGALGMGYGIFLSCAVKAACQTVHVVTTNRRAMVAPASYAVLTDAELRSHKKQPAHD